MRLFVALIIAGLFIPDIAFAALADTTFNNGNSDCTLIQSGDTCEIPITAAQTGFSDAVIQNKCLRLTIRQTEANVVEVHVGQDGDFFHPPTDHTLTTVDGWVNLGEGSNPEAWESFKINVTTATGGIVYATCK